MTTLVTGATGNLGRLVIASLLERGVSATSIVAGARDVAKGADLGVRVVPLDYDDPSSIRAALDGVDTVVLISAPEVGQRLAQHQAVIDAARSADVAKFVYTSVTRASTSGLILAAEHKATEESISAAGLPAVILRNNWYHENYAADLALAAETGILASAVGDGRVASASRKDYADAVAVVVLEDGHIGEIYELAGDAVWDYGDLAAAFAEITGRDVSYEPISFEQKVAALREAGLDERLAGLIASLDTGIADGALDDSDGTLARLIGRPTTPLIEGLRAAAA